MKAKGKVTEIEFDGRWSEAYKSTEDGSPGHLTLMVPWEAIRKIDPEVPVTISQHVDHKK